MNKNIEYLAFIDKETGEIKERFEIHLEGKEDFEGRRCQLIKKLVGYSIKQRWIKFPQLFDYLKRTDLVTTRDLLAYAFGRDD